MSENVNRFDLDAVNWDAEPRRVKLAQDIVAAVKKIITVGVSWDILDFGCGTGLVGAAFLPSAASVTFVDNSSGMLDEVRRKIEKAGFKNAETVRVDISRGGKLQGVYDLIVTAMALHHIKDTGSVIRAFYAALKPGGFVCVADLDPDGGKFHSDHSGVYHRGFNREIIRGLLADSGFRDISDQTASIIQKPSGDFSAFLVTGRK